ncbi:MAG: amidohydrolase family protein [Pseudomonadota bacterium]
MKTLFKFQLLALTLTALAAHASVNTPAPAHVGSFVLTNATIHPITADPITIGWIHIQDGKISEMGSMDTPHPSGDQIVDLQGKHVYPGLISANSSLGLTEVAAVRATNDLAEVGLLNPNVKAQVAINPDSELIPVARANGILHSLIVPIGGLITGQSTVIQLDGWTWEDMTLVPSAGLHIRWPQMRYATGQYDSRLKKKEDFEKQLDTLLDALDDAFEQAKAYSDAKKSNDIPTDPRWESMRGIWEGELRVFAHAQDIRQINHALNLAKKYELPLVIVGGRDAWRVSERLKSRNVPVIVTPIHSLPLRRWEDFDAAFSVPNKLHEAGVAFCIAGGEGGFSAANQRSLPYQAATAVAHGLDIDEGVKAVTLYPARILGIDHRVGSLEPGKEATMIVTTGNPLDIRTQIEQAFIAGRTVDLSSRHTRLYEKYQERYRQLDSN